MTDAETRVAAGLGVARDVAKSYEPDRYLSALLAPRPARAPLIILAAFTGELSRITQIAGEPLLGEMRLQWWRDALSENATGSHTGNPLADALRAVLTIYDLPADLTDAIIDASAARLYSEPRATLTELTNEFAASQGAPFQLAALVVAKHGADPTTVETSKAIKTARGAGIAYGLARLVYDLPRSLARCEHPLPLDLMKDHGITPAMLTVPDAPSRQLVEVLQHLRNEADRQLTALKDTIGATTPPERAAYLPLAMVGPYLQTSSDHDEKSYAAYAPLMPHARVWHIWRLHRTGRLAGRLE